MSTIGGHRLFAAFWDFATRHESRHERRARQWVTVGSSGRVLEIGFGVGSNWQYLPDGVTYTGIEPDPYMLARARNHLAEKSLPLELVEASAERTPFPDDTFDTVFTTLTLCSVASLDASLAEIRRVLKPGGTLRYWEHLRPQGRVGGLAFDAIAPAWRQVGAGCHPNRRTEDAIRMAGFVIEVSRRVRSPLPMRAGFALAPSKGTD